MGSIWTPGGEYPTSGREEPASRKATAEPSEPTQAQLEAEMAEMQRQIASTPARVVVANHAIGLFQLAAIHLNQRPPNLDEGRLAIDAMAVLVEGMQGRLGDEEPALVDALSQVRLAYVQLSQGGGQTDAGASADG